MKKFVFLFMVALASGWIFAAGRAEFPAGDGSGSNQVPPSVLKSQNYEHYIETFNADDHEFYPAYITNGAVWDFLKTNIPLFECSDKEIERTYYFRWWTYRKHIAQTPEGFIISEFL